MIHGYAGRAGSGFSDKLLLEEFLLNAETLYDDHKRLNEGVGVSGRLPALIRARGLLVFGRPSGQHGQCLQSLGLLPQRPHTQAVDPCLYDELALRRGSWVSMFEVDCTAVRSRVH